MELSYSYPGPKGYMGLYKTWILDWIGLYWTGLDWTDQKQMYTDTKATRA